MQNATGLNRGLLEWESERHNRIRQEARNAARKTAVPAEDYAYKVSFIPEIRSALIPLDAAREGESWSNPFSLAQADIEPWISFHQGYGSSRLFLSPGMHGDADCVDFAVRALLELKRIDAKVILEPPVRIDGCCEYADIGDASGTRGDVILRRVQQTHEKLLQEAVAKGRAMGDRLYEALMGEGYVRLIATWEKVHGRKPTPAELQLMLTTGRLKPASRERPPAAAAVIGDIAASATTVVQKEAAPAAPAMAVTPPKKPRLSHKVLLHVCAASICGTVLLAWAMLA